MHFNEYKSLFQTYSQAEQLCLKGRHYAILDNTGAAVVTYSYDPWGALLAIGSSKAATLGKLNPFRYRGYVYDDETGLYYLRSRYYKPEWCRFINSDTVLGEVGAVGSHNLFAYCGNNPVMKVDPDGNIAFPLYFGYMFLTAFGLAAATQLPPISLPKISLPKVSITSSAAIGVSSVSVTTSSITNPRVLA